MIIDLIIQIPKILFMLASCFVAMMFLIGAIKIYKSDYKRSSGIMAGVAYDLKQKKVIFLGNDLTRTNKI